ncbi:MAG TPA: RiPP maturation radical SAM C-methyltransferase [Candidatus Angelobacter sp.]|nr:RiPP maturation radical SAM C-methyltransferase [Candidatus Angelobacter sp.]
MTEKLKPVALVSMPSLSARHPSFQLALLKPLLEEAGIPAQQFSLFMYLGTQVGWRLAETLADVWPCLVGEWIWSKSAFGEQANTEDDNFFAAYAGLFETICDRAGCTLEDIRKLRDVGAPEFIDFCINAVDWSRFGLIGFTVVFQQLVGSLALARALKQRYPNIPIIMGGASLEDDIADQIIRNCPQIDYVHCGDAEISFPEMIRRLYGGRSMEGLPGIMWRDAQGSIRYAGRAPNFMDMNRTPLPDFDEYFYARQASGYEQSDSVQELLVPFEAARGCWWGEKNHCTFCGLNRSGMEFRAKDPDKVLEQLEALSRRYGQFYFNAIDNIMAPEYVEKLFGRLAAANSDLCIHYEIRPNFSRSQLGRLRRSGMFSVQPGIESLSTNILKIMRKHSTGMRNVELIKWCTYYGINALYNILCRFPGETEEDYRLQCEIASKITHLQPPYAIVKARADRGSPMYTEPETQSISGLVPARCYQYIFPKSFDLRRISYYFDHQMANTVDDNVYEELFGRVGAWQEGWNSANRPFLKYRKAWHNIAIFDGRQPEVLSYSYHDDAAALYEYCGEARTPRDISANFGNDAWIQDALKDFVSKDLMLALDGRYLSLALPENRYFDLTDRPERQSKHVAPEPSAELIAR